MLKKQSDLDNAAALRHKAEQIAGERQAPQLIAESLSPDETLRLIHDLRVHQIQLEMQNDELRRIQAELEASHARYFDLFDLAPVGYLILNTLGIILEANLTAATLLGVNRGQLIGYSFRRFITEKYQDIYYFHVNELNETDTSQSFDLELSSKKRAFWVQLQISTGFNSKGERVLRYVFNDITARKQAEDAQQRSFSFLDAVIENSPLAMWISDETGTLIRANQALRDRLHVTDAEIVGKYNIFTDNLIIKQGHLPKVQAVFKQGAVARFVIEYNTSQLENLKLAQFTNVSLDVTISPVINAAGKVNNAIIQHVDMTDQRQAEQTLRESEARFRNMADTAPVMIWMAGTDTLCDYFNQSWLDFTGRTLEQELGNDWSKGIHPNDQQRCLDVYLGAFKARHKFEIEYRLRRAQGDYGWVLDKGIPRFTPDGNFIGYIGSCVDITERKLAEEELHASEARYRRLVEGAPDVVYTFSNKRGGIYYSPSVENVLGYSLQHLYAHPYLWSESIHPDDSERIGKVIREFELGKPFDIEYRIRDARGNWHWLQDRSIGKMISPAEILIEGLAIDITERKLASQRLNDSLAEKDALLREVHHRVKNNLAAIIALIGLQQAGLADPATRVEFTELGSRINAMALVHELLYRSETLTWIDMQTYLDSLIAQLQILYQISGTILVSVTAQNIRIDLDTAIPCGLIVSELLTNSFKHAFPGGRPRIGEKVCKISVSFETLGKTKKLRVCDNGVGLPAGLDWEKAPTLGLRLIRMLGVHQLSAVMHVDTSAGTCFEITFDEKIRN